MLETCKVISIINGLITRSLPIIYIFYSIKTSRSKFPICFIFKATFHEGGFSYEDYPIELAWTLRTSSLGAAGLGSEKSRMSGGEKKAR